MIRTGVFGGSFNPPHVGHLIVAEQARVQARLDRVLWIPARQSPHKEDGDVVDPRHRLAMVALAIEGHPAFGIWDGELHRPGPSYTVDTLTELTKEHPDWELHLILGGDSLREFSTWRDPEGIRSLARLIVYPRGGTVPPEAVPDAGVTVLDVPEIPVSATDLRHRLARGGSIRYFVPESVHRYVTDHGLYR